ncbi:U3 small nucleolar RNA-associated protein 15 homolog [Pomacea canaliculata]|uniref:U3 small nucleolar RNA-associated protein 15 homolog n=1 Tax=Pomacea canaliculata TaxID=400727 RepID=UPI000D73BB23|nr:U3 small nucleolar RNA-associated protein 15 homolog [Pomacea canaliculata]
MATAFKKTPVVNPLTFGEKNTPDALYWKSLDIPITKKEYGAITSIDFSSVSPYSYAVTNSTRVQIYSARSNQIIRSLNRFKEVARSGSFRADGKLIVAGSDEPVVRLFDPTTRSQLRVFKGHTGPVNVTKFLSDSLRVMSASDDKTARVWDIATEAELIKYEEHTDYIRCGVACRSSADIFLTGSYDHKAKLFDTRREASVLTVEHGHPVESVLMFPSGNIFMTAGGNVIKVWDAMAGGRLLTTLSHHHKTITSLCFCSQHKRFMSGSLDRHIKIYDVSSYQPVHSLDYPGAILSLAVAPDDSVLAVGMADGLLSIQSRNKAERGKTPKKKASFHYRLKGKTFVAKEEDIVVINTRKEKMARYDRLLKRFEHSKALDAAMELHTRCKHPEVTLGVLQELIRRGVLRAVLAGRDPRHLQGVLRFIQQNLCKPNFAPTLLDVLGTFFSLYEESIGGNALMESLTTKVKRTMEEEISYQKKLMQLQGLMLVVISGATSAARDVTPEASLTL